MKALLRSETERLEGPRSARPGELGIVLETVNKVMRVDKGLKPTIRTDYPMIYNEENLSNIIVIKNGNHVVSSAAVWINSIEIGSARLKVGGINCLVTAPEYRRRGLASEVMQASHKHMAELGCHVARLTTHIAGWYNRLGWEAAGSYGTYEINRSNMALLPVLGDDISISCHRNDFEESTMVDLVRLHQADKLGGVRSPELLRTLLKAGSDPEVTPDTWIVFAIRRDEPVAYLLDRGNIVIEWGGRSDLIAGLLRAWYERAERHGTQAKRARSSNADYSDKVTLTAPNSGHALLQLLRARFFPCRLDYWGMLYTLDPRGILDAFGRQDVFVGEQNGEFTLERGSARVTVSRSQLTKLLFGPERISDFVDDVLPFTFWEWPIEHV